MPASKTLGREFVVVALWLFFPSMAVVQKFLGVAGVVAYASVMTLFLYIGYKWAFRAFCSRVPERAIPWLVAATFLTLLLMFVVVYPLADSGIVGRGSDRDEALNIGVMELLRGHYPYYQETYFGNAISPMPGALLLAIPFVLVGNSAYQNFFWLFAFLLFARSYLKDGRSALLLLWTILAFSPVVLQEFVTGGDYLANGLYVLLAVMWLVRSVPRSDLSDWKPLIAAALLGIALSSRANFATLLPLIFSALVAVSGWKTAAKYTAVACAVSAAVTLPFYLYDPGGFSPLSTAALKLDEFQSVIPFVGMIVPLVTGLISLALALLSANRDPSIMLRNCAIVLVFPVLCGVVLSSVGAGRPEFWFSSYALPAMIFGVVASWPGLLQNALTYREI
jgi:hypothetical protein